MSQAHTPHAYALDIVGSPFLAANVSFSTALPMHHELFDKQDSPQHQVMADDNFNSSASNNPCILLKMSLVSVYSSHHRVALSSS
jgi:hypothetical protein